MGLPRPPASDEYFGEGRPPIHQQLMVFLENRSWGGLPRVRTVSTSREFDDIVDEYVTCGYDILDRNGSTILLKKRTWGSPDAHLMWAVGTFWTLGIGNLAYALFSHINAEQVVIRFDPQRLI